MRAGILTGSADRCDVDRTRDLGAVRPVRLNLGLIYAFAFGALISPIAALAILGSRRPAATA
jgi:hypothetical protein